MQVFKTKTELGVFIADCKTRSKTIGFVPTMGALHQGHLSLIAYAKKESDITLASIFVNPTQFNDPNDLKNYPRNEAKDLEMLLAAGCNAVFMPNEAEMYPEKDSRIFDFDGLDQLMEGAHRPGHFNGVAQIVSKLFDAVQPHKAFFGQKDFQQVAIIRKMTQSLGLPIEIVACPIVREDDGLAMSSRNQLLTPEHRKAAPLIYKTLQKARTLAYEKTVSQLQAWVEETINDSGLFRVEYFEIVDEQTLLPISTFTAGKNNVGCIAVWAGKVRLIDNVTINL
ncbi:MAG: pantoate--beta-alanine ligase [Salinivirgaceae bacterium]